MSPTAAAEITPKSKNQGEGTTCSAGCCPWGWLDTKSLGSLWMICKTKAMAQADRQPKTVSRLEIANARVSAAERAHLHQVARDRSTTLSGLIRQALRNDGAMPAD